MDNIQYLFSGADQRALTLLNELEKTIMERAVGLPIPTILGTLDLCKDLVKSKVLK